MTERIEIIPKNFSGMTEEEWARLKREVDAIPPTEELAKVRVVSNGISAWTMVLVDGKPLDGVLAAEWRMDNEGFSHLVLTIEGAEADVAAQAIEVKRA